MYRMLIINDMHCGHLLGLTTPKYHSEAYPWQAKAWNFYKNSVGQIGPVDDLVINGDAVDGEGKKDTQAHLTTDVNKQIEMAIEICKLPKAKRKHVVRGTGFHVDGPCSYEDMLASELNTDAHDDLRLEIHGRKLHIRHVVGRSDTPYGSFTQLQKEQINDIIQGEFEDYKAADILIRAHVHYCYEARTADSVKGFMRSVYTAPALQMRGPIQSSFTRKLRTWKYDFGFTLLEIDKTGEHFIRPILMPIKSYAKKEYTCLS